MTLLNITGTSRIARAGTAGRPSARRIARWGAQGVLAALFLFAGGVKFALPVEVLTAGSPFPAWFLLAIGALEVLGAFGLLASLAGRRLGRLVRPAAVGLAIIMAGQIYLQSAAKKMTIPEGIPTKAKGRRNGSYAN